MKIYLFLWVSILTCLGGDVTFTSTDKQLQVKYYSLVQTNWAYQTNFIEAYYGWDGQGGIMTFQRTPNILVGTVTSNNLCDVTFYDSTLRSNLLRQTTIGKINVTWETNIVAKTNYTTP